MVCLGKATVSRFNTGIDLMFPKYPGLDHLIFAYSTIGRPQIDERSIRVKVRDLYVEEGFPGYDNAMGFRLTEATLVIEGVVSSERRIREYSQGFRTYLDKLAHDWDASIMPGFKGEAYTITDGPFAEVKKPVYSIHYSGVSHDPEAWVEWEIAAASIRIEVGEE